MKLNVKIPALLLLLLLLSLAAAAIAFGGVVGSLHDLSTATTPTPCLFCHTPHSSNPNIKPLWNRTISDTTLFVAYGSATMNTTPSTPPSSRSLACLSCHVAKGSGVLNLSSAHDLIDAPGPGGRPDTTSSPDCSKCHNYMGVELQPWYQIGPNLKDDHPISMTYPTAAQDPAFNAPPDLQKGWSDVKLIGGMVECASCHDPHDPSKGKFLRKANDGSALCLTCHIK